MSGKAEDEKTMDVSGHEGDVEDLEDVEEEEESGAITSKLLKDPSVLAALTNKLSAKESMTPSAYIESLPASVKRRIKALKRLQADVHRVETEFYKKVHDLEMEFMEKYQPFYNKRMVIVSGAHEPTEEECDWPSDEEDKDDKKLSDDLQNKVKVEEGMEGAGDATKAGGLDVKGIPDFWLTVLKNVDLTGEMIQEHDEPILRHLTDVTVHLEKDPMRFILKFHFSSNEFFTNSVLVKEYEMTCDVNEEEPLSYEGPDIKHCRGCKIDWKKDKNVTVKMVKKKQKHKSRGSVRVVTKQVKNDSFFNFFDPPTVTNEKDIDEDTQALLDSDFEIGHFLRERVVPKAVLYFTGEALEEEEDEMEEEGEEEDDDEDDDNVDDKKAEPPSECKQQ